MKVIVKKKKELAWFFKKVRSLDAEENKGSIFFQKGPVHASTITSKEIKKMTHITNWVNKGTAYFSCDPY